MPFKSEKHRGFMWARHPSIARRWTKKYGSAIKKDKDAITKLSNALREKK